MKRGRKPKPTHLKVVNGSAAKHPDRVNKDEPKAPADAPKMPDYLDAMAKRAFTRKCEQLRRLGILSSVDADLIENYAVTYSQYRRLLVVIKQTGGLTIVKREKKEVVEVKRNPAAIDLHRCRAELLKMDAEMGLTPSSRTRVHADVVPGDAGSDGDLRKEHGS